MDYNPALSLSRLEESMATRRMKLPSWTTIIAWLGVIGTLLGIIGFFAIDLPGLLHPQPRGLDEAAVVGTLSALQDQRDRAELQLTHIAIANQQSANQSTQQALDQQQAVFLATVGAVQTEQAAFISTQNAIAAASATAQAEMEAATAAAGTASAHATATANALAQIVPTFTATPTETPPPTITPTPAPVTDYRALRSAGVQLSPDGRLEFTLQTAEPIPDPPPADLSYVWLLDTDRSPATGLSVQDMGVDVRVAVRAQDRTWIGTLRTVQADSSLGDPFLFTGITISGPRLSANLNPQELGLPDSFDWVARAETDGQAFPFFPEIGHRTFGP